MVLMGYQGKEGVTNMLSKVKRAESDKYHSVLWGTK